MKARQAVEAVRHGFAVEHDAAEGEGAQGLGDGAKLGRPVAPVSRPQAHALALLVGEDAEAIVLQLMQPAVAVRAARMGWHGTMKPGGTRRFGRTQRVGVRINMDAPSSAWPTREVAEAGWRGPARSDQDHAPHMV